MFENVIGNKEKIEYLKKSIEKNNISHAYLFEGKEGIGKCFVAKEFAKELLKVDNLESCVDFKYINKDEDKKDIAVEQIRSNIVEDTYIVPAASNYKVYIIDNAQNLNFAAQNALLKTLEEPQKYVVIILIASTVKSFLPTILSRVNKVVFEGVDYKTLQEYVLEKFNIKLNSSVVKYLSGSIGLAISFIQSGQNKIFEQIDEIYKLIENKDLIKTLTDIKDKDFTKNNSLDYLESLLFENSKYSCVKHVEKAKLRLKNNGNYDIVIDTMILKIIDEI